MLSGRLRFSFRDSFILERGGLAQVTAVARSNFDIVQSEWTAFVHSNLDLIPNCPIEEGIHIHSEKYGDIKGWKPYRGS
jgi:2-dehydropantoate 2-reductase